jgi:hypothetical protein
VSLEELIIAAVRLLGALPVLVSPFFGGVFALVVDQSDLLLMNLLDLGGVSNYQPFDKYLDQAYLATFLIVALRWQGLERGVAVGLFAYRLAGFLTFELTGARWLLIFFPNVFEFWFLFVAGLHQFRPGVRLSDRGYVIVLAALLALKIGQEYLLHVAKVFDDFTTVEAIEAVWDFLTGPFG